MCAVACGVRLFQGQFFFFHSFLYCTNIYLQINRLRARATTTTTSVAPNDDKRGSSRTSAGGMFFPIHSFFPNVYVQLNRPHCTRLWATTTTTTPVAPIDDERGLRLVYLFILFITVLTFIYLRLIDYVYGSLPPPPSPPPSPLSLTPTTTVNKGIRICRVPCTTALTNTLIWTFCFDGKLLLSFSHCHLLAEKLEPKGSSLNLYWQAPTFRCVTYLGSAQVCEENPVNRLKYLRMERYPRPISSWIYRNKLSRLKTSRDDSSDQFCV